MILNTIIINIVHSIINANVLTNSKGTKVIVTKKPITPAPNSPSTTMTSAMRKKEMTIVPPNVVNIDQNKKLTPELKIFRRGMRICKKVRMRRAFIR